MKRLPAMIDAASVEELDGDIRVAEEYEHFLARRQYRVRQFVLNLKSKRDHLRDLGEAIWRGA